MPQATASMPLGIVIRKSPGVTRWAQWAWKAVAVLPGAPDRSWYELRREGEAVEYHAATVPLELWRGETEAYLTALSSRVPSIGVVLRPTPGSPTGLEVVMATASPYETQDYLDSGEEIVELVPMPEGLVGWIHAFVQEHHEDEVFVKRRRDKRRVDMKEDGKGDARIPQMADVFRAPGSRRGRLQ
ncbi:DUF3305 domain-containing protein [Pseudoruegeria sp. SHC-113]|uniref:DUF3305 domain-containing protein n=1 Tax=Pseudoruegeria sp. SHC-113 TaxID=2855439 RepID=UPI0021BAE4E8|nr:DUF3305 domain-containing protein [Pseudoruegeria sp. SHC-113]